MTTTLSKRSLETLIDLVEIKHSCVEVWDQEDAREKMSLELAKRELVAMLAGGAVVKSARIRAPKRVAIRIPDTAGVAYVAPVQPEPLQFHS